MKTDCNFLVGNDYVVGDERDLFFCGEPVTVLPAGADMFDVLVAAKIFSSRSQARKDGRDREIPQGWSDFVAGKLRARICIFKPTERNLLTATVLQIFP